MSQIKVYTLFLVMLLFLPACTVIRQSDVAPLPTLATSVQVSETRTIPISTQSPVEIAPLTLTPLPTQNITAVDSSITLTFTPMPSITPTPSVTPIPTYDSSLSNSLGFLFSAYLCTSAPSCENDTVARGQAAQTYFFGMNSEEPELLEKNSIVPNDIFQIRHVTFSHDQKYIAYSTIIDNEWRVVIADTNNYSNKELIFVPPDFEYFEILSGEKCVIFFRENDLQNGIRLEKSCSFTGSLKVIDETVFTEMAMPQRLNYRISPRGDKFLAFGRDKDNSVHLYIKRIGDDSPPKRIYHSQFPCDDGRYRYVGDVSWNPDGETIQFMTNGNCGEEFVDTFYSIKSNGENLITVFSQFGDSEIDRKSSIRFGDWTADGRQFVYTPAAGIAPEFSGIYILDLDTGTVQQILSGFYVTSIKVWRPDIWSVNN